MNERRIVRIISFSSILIFLTLICTYSCKGMESANKDKGNIPFVKIEGDPLNARIYTLDNGLKVYMSVNRKEPRIKTAVVVRAGAKNDPAEATGMAHCIEHMMFKGTDEFGTVNFNKEKVHLGRIEDLFENYGEVRDSTERSRIYSMIDSISYLASSYAISGEYDRMLGGVGSDGINAHTDMEKTIYVSDIPSNKIMQWLTVEYERFKDPVFRLFHTELEAIYEEKNSELDSDREKVIASLDSCLWRRHPYGDRTVLGCVDDLRNPSIKIMKKFYDEYYVPNNMAICLSGDFEPDSVIKMIDRTFGKLEPGEIPEFESPIEDSIEKPFTREVSGPERESVTIGFRLPGVHSGKKELLLVTDWIMMNGVAGIMDLNLRNQQKVINPFCNTTIRQDYSKHVFSARPREGQSLGEVRDLLLSQIELLKEGDFQEWLPEAASNVLHMIVMEMNQTNSGRIFSFVDAFTNNIPWKKNVGFVGRLKKITKKDIVGYANEYYKDNYAVIFKRNGKIKKIDRLHRHDITPAITNRDKVSPFARDISDMKYPDIEPVYPDFKKDISKLGLDNGVPVLYNHNPDNSIFKLYFVSNMGTNHNRKLEVSIKYLDYLGTENLTSREIKERLFRDGCLMRKWVTEDRLYISLTGLKDNLAKDIQILEEILDHAMPDENVLEELIYDIIRERENRKLNKNEILEEAMMNYGKYGNQSPFTNVISEKELHDLKTKDIIHLIKNIKGYKHRFLYYGPHSKNELSKVLSKYHNVPDQLKRLPREDEFKQLPMKENTVYLCDYDMKQVRVVFLSKSVPYSKENAAVRKLFNEYYDGNMGSIVFQRLRESEGLAYTVQCTYTTPENRDESHYVYACINTSPEKLSEAMAGVYELLNEMPESEKCLRIAKESIINKVKTERITGDDILFEYEERKRLGIEDFNLREKIYREVPSLDMEDLRSFFYRYISGRNYAILVLGSQDNLDFDALEEYGKVRELTLRDLFGY